MSEPSRDKMAERQPKEESNCATPMDGDSLEKVAYRSLSREQIQDARSRELMQELASAGPSAIESFGPEPGGMAVWCCFEDSLHHPIYFRVRCGLFCAGGDHE